MVIEKETKKERKEERDRESIKLRYKRVMWRDHMGETFFSWSSIFSIPTERDHDH